METFYFLDSAPIFFFFFPVCYSSTKRHSLSLILGHFVNSAPFFSARLREKTSKIRGVSETRAQRCYVSSGLNKHTECCNDVHALSVCTASVFPRLTICLYSAARTSQSARTKQKQLQLKLKVPESFVCVRDTRGAGKVLGMILFFKHIFRWCVPQRLPLQ